MLQRSRRVHRLVLQVEVDAPVLGQRKGVQMGVRRAIGVGLDPTDGLVRPRSRTEPARPSEVVTCAVSPIPVARAARPRDRFRAAATGDGDVGGDRASVVRAANAAAVTITAPAGASWTMLSSTGSPRMCASVTGRSPSCSRRSGGVPHARARGRRGGRGSRRRSPGRPPCRRRERSSTRRSHERRPG